MSHLLTEPEAAERLRIGERTLRDIRKRDGIPGIVPEDVRAAFPIGRAA